jgi:hypothetical protein
MTSENTPRPILVRPREAARLAGVGLTRLYELLNADALESRKLGRARLVSVASIERLGQAQVGEAP